MIHQHPIYAFVLSILVVGIIIKQCIIKNQILKGRLIFSFFLVFATAFFLIFYKEIIENDDFLQLCDYSLLGVNIIIAFMFFTSINASISEQSFHKEFMNSLDKSKIYILLDKKDKIKEISELLTKELLSEKSVVINKKFFNVIEDVWRINSFNGQETSNESLKQFYKNYHLTAKANSPEKRELIIIKKHGEEIVLNLMETAIFVGNKYKGRLLIGDKKTTDTMLNIEKELVDKHFELDSIRLRFISALEITEEAIFFKNLDDNSIWGNDLFVENLKLSDNNMGTDEYIKQIHPDDLPHYLEILNSLNEAEPHYNVTYRFNFGASYKFVKELGKRIFENKKVNEILGFVKVINANHYERSNIEELDNILSSDELLAKASRLYEQNKIFELVTFRLDNISKINDEHGRNAGNMLMSRYVEMIRKNFISDEDDIFRLGGVEFAFIITDFRLMEKLKKYLSQDEKILHVKTKFGSISLVLEVSMGLALSTDTIDQNELMEASLKALRFAEKPQVKSNYAYYKDII